jgi:hypothetical protein
MNLGDFVRATHIGRGDFIEGELIAYDDAGFFFILKDGHEYYLNTRHYYLKKLSTLETELS